ncbi:hypothetical protein J6590_041616 [Homalodisca vitripennis]|nr:hypothetical protein J6590_041616 [Homalodisca vitripennis]
MFNANTASPCKLQRGAGKVAVSGLIKPATSRHPLPPLRLPWRHHAEIKEMAQPLILGPGSDHSGSGSNGEPDNDLHQVTAQQTTPRHRRPAVRVPPHWSLEAPRILTERDRQNELIEVRSTVSAWKQCELAVA